MCARLLSPSSGQRSRWVRRDRRRRRSPRGPRRAPSDSPPVPRRSPLALHQRADRDAPARKPFHQAVPEALGAARGLEDVGRLMDLLHPLGERKAPHRRHHLRRGGPSDRNTRSSWPRSSSRRAAAARRSPPLRRQCQPRWRTTTLDSGMPRASRTRRRACASGRNRSVSQPATTAHARSPAPARPPHARAPASRPRTCRHGDRPRRTS